VLRNAHLAAPVPGPIVCIMTKFSRAIFTVVTLLTPAAALGAVTLIDASQRNGSFETGLATPWSGVDVVQDSTFAAQGSWYASLHSATSPTARQLAFQFFNAHKSDGLTFTATFYARNSAIGFDTVSVDFFGRNVNGTFAYAVATPVLAPALVSSEWREYQTVFQLAPTWDGIGDISLQIQLTKTGAVSGTTYTGFLDAITLAQVPEPAAVALLGLAGGGYIAGRSLRSRKRRDR